MLRGASGATGILGRFLTTRTARAPRAAPLPIPDGSREGSRSGTCIGEGERKELFWGARSFGDAQGGHIPKAPISSGWTGIVSC
jgi:hypothetical protein